MQQENFPQENNSKIPSRNFPQNFKFQEHLDNFVIFFERESFEEVKENIKSQCILNNYVNFVKLLDYKENSNQCWMSFEKQSFFFKDLFSFFSVDFDMKLMLFKQVIEIIRILKALYGEKFDYFNLNQFFVDENFLLSFNEGKIRTPILKVLYHGIFLLFFAFFCFFFKFF